MHKSKLSAVLAMVVIGAALLGAPSARADKAIWKVSGVGISSPKSISSFGGSVKLELPAKEPVVTCGVMSFSGFIEPHGEGSGNLSFSSCSAAKGCELSTNPSAQVAALLVVSGETTRVEINSLFLSFKFVKACGASESASGSMTLECTDANCSTNQATHTMKISTGLGYMSKTATLTGSIGLQLSAGGEWRAHTWPAGNWKVAGTSITKAKEVTATVKEPVTMLVTLAGFPVNFSCKESVAEDALLLTGGLSSATVKFSKCETVVKGVVFGSCKPQEPIKFNIKGELLAHEGHTYVHVLPATGATMFVLELGEECAFGEELPVTGSLVVECSKGCEAENAIQTLGHAANELFPKSVLKIASSTVTIDGSASLALTGAEEGKSWSGIVQ
jgi:hypothetical protein